MVDIHTREELLQITLNFIIQGGAIPFCIDSVRLHFNAFAILIEYEKQGSLDDTDRKLIQSSKHCRDAVIDSLKRQDRFQAALLLERFINDMRKGSR